MEYVERLRYLIGKNQLDEALQLFHTAVKDKSELQDALTQITQSYHTLKDDEMMGILSFEQRNLSRSRITRNMLALAERFLQGAPTTPPAFIPDIPASNPSTPHQKVILFLAANPEATTHLRLDQELRDIEEGLKLAPNGDQFKLISKQAVRAKDIQRALLETRPYLVHFSGHGTAQGELIIETSRGDNHYLEPDSVGELFELFADTVQCVVLNACFSEIQAHEIVKYIPYVVGMKAEISDKKAALPFSIAFYDGLGNNRGIEFAVKLAKNRIKLEGGKDHEMPVLKIKP